MDEKEVDLIVNPEPCVEDVLIPESVSDFADLKNVVSALIHFICENWFADLSNFDFQPSQESDLDKNRGLMELIVDGEFVSSFAVNSSRFVKIYKSLFNPETNCKMISVYWWRLRSILVYQKIMGSSNPVFTFKDKLIDTINSFTSEIIEDETVNASLKLQLNGFFKNV